MSTDGPFEVNKLYLVCEHCQRMVSTPQHELIGRVRIWCDDCLVAEGPLPAGEDDDDD